MTRSELAGEEFIYQIMTQAVQQGEWTIRAHQDFLMGVSAAVKSTLGISKDFRLPMNASVDMLHRLPPDLPCSREAAIFELAIEVDSDPEISPDPQLINKAKEICSSCVAQAHCLENGESPPLLLMGIFGGKTMEERRPKWEERMRERANELEAVYTGVGQKLLELVSKTDEPAPFFRELSNLQEAYFPSAQDQETTESTKTFPEYISHILTDPKIIERACIVLPTQGQRMLRHWVNALEQGKDPFDYASAESTISKSNVPKTESNIQKVVTALHEGAFDYSQWARGTANSQERSPLIFLCLITGEFPEGDETALKALAQQKLAELENFKQVGRGPKSNTARYKNMLIDYYGLQGRPLGIEEMTKRYNLTPAGIRSNLKNALALLRM